MTTAQYTFCPTCGTRRIGHSYRCSVCNGLLPRPRVPSRVVPSVAHTLLTWPTHETPSTPDRQPVAA